MEIFHISAECYPVAKVGGLADVVGALPKYLNKHGQNAKVVLLSAEEAKIPGSYVFSDVFNNIRSGLCFL